MAGLVNPQIMNDPASWSGILICVLQKPRSRFDAGVREWLRVPKKHSRCVHTRHHGARNSAAVALFAIVLRFGVDLTPEKLP